MRRQPLGTLLAVAVLAALTVPAGAADRGTGTIDSVEATASWAGSFADTGGISLPEVYAVAESCEIVDCDTYTLALDLPPEAWDSPGGLQIAVQWPDEANDLDLYVYGPDGALAARSDGFFASTGESVRIAHAANGTYRVVVVPRFVDGAMDYEGFAEIEYAPAKDPVRPLLPNLVALPPRNLNFATGAYLTDPGVPGEASSCYPEEMIEQGARRCLRFDQIIANVGEGPFELRYRMEGLATEQELRQRIYNSDGTHTERFADTYEFHAAHAHFHYRNFAQSKLYRANPDGSAGELVATGKKNGFCLIDVENTAFGPGHKGESPRTYFFPRCNAPTERDESGTYMTNGISPGWADVYNWFLADQFIEVSGVAPGIYVLETITDPADTVLESTNDDNVTSVLIELTDTGASFVD